MMMIMMFFFPQTRYDSNKECCARTIVYPVNLVFYCLFFFLWLNIHNVLDTR